MNKEKIKQLAIKEGFKLKEQPGGKTTDLNPYVYDFANILIQESNAEKQNAYRERNMVVAALAKLFPAYTTRTAIEGWSEDWHGCVFISLPTGQVSWHYHDSHAEYFKDIPYIKDINIWDGHSTEEKYRRLNSLTRNFGGASYKKPTSRMENWYVIGNTLFGNVYEHSDSKRCPDGLFIRSSKIVRLAANETFCETVNTVYILGKRLSI